MKNLVFSIDIDGIICENNNFENYKISKPIKENIKKINELYDKGNTIILNTARLEEDRYITIEWLYYNKVKYDVLLMNKIRADFYLDDRNITIKEFLII